MFDADELEALEAMFMPQGRAYRLRWGPAYQGAQLPPLNKKLCLTATDKAFLVRLLYEFSALPECYAVKYSHTAKDGMYLGRIFVTDEAELGRLWSDLRDHPKLMCSLQDDDAVARFRLAEAGLVR